MMLIAQESDIKEMIQWFRVYLWSCLLWICDYYTLFQSFVIASSYIESYHEESKRRSFTILVRQRNDTSSLLITQEQAMYKRLWIGGTLW